MALINKLYEKYRAIGILAFIAVGLKLFIFYKFIGVNSVFFVVWLITGLLTFLFFSSFRNKWIPLIFFTFLSFLLFADAVYFSFFNRYLSVQMLGAAEVLGDIGDSVKAVIRPKFFLLFVDLIPLYIWAWRIRNYSWNVQKVTWNSDFVNIEGNEPTFKAKLPVRIYWKKPLAVILVLLLLVVNPGSFPLLTSISNQELYSYHIKDLVGGAKEAMGIGSGNLSIFKDHYKTEKDGPLFGVAKGKNLIVIQLESFQNFVIGMEYNGQEVTPNLNALLKENTIYFDNYYQQIGSGNTSDAEFASNNSMYGSLTSYTYKLFGNNYFRGLPVLLSEQGYSTAVFHGFDNRSFWNREAAYPSLGFQRYYGGAGDYAIKERIGWGMADTDFFPQTVTLMQELEEPFYSFVISLSQHHPFKMPAKYDFIKLLPEDKDTTAGNYLNSAAYVDHALGIFFKDLKKAGLYENSIIAIYGDHVGLTHAEDIDSSMNRLLGKTYDFQHMMNIPLIITLPETEGNTPLNQTVSTAGGQMDLMPTLAYLMGFEKLDTLYFGHNLLTVDSGFVAEQTYMPRGSFFNDAYGYEMSRDGVFENGRAWNLKTGERVSVKPFYEGYLKSKEIVEASEFILRTDALRQIYIEGKSPSKVGKKEAARPHPEAFYVGGYTDGNDKDFMGDNSIAALEHSYSYGMKTIKTMAVFGDWDEDLNPVFYKQKIGKADEVSPDKGREISMTWEELLSFMERHGDVVLLVRMEKNGNKFISFMNEQNSMLRDRLILWVPDVEEYIGKNQGIWDLSNFRGTAADIEKLVQKKGIWAVSISKEALDKRYGGKLNVGTRVYCVEDGKGSLLAP